MSPSPDSPRIAYVLKRFPRFSETFILNELLAHQATGAELHVFSLRQPPEEPRHERFSELRAEITYLDQHRGEGVAAIPGDDVLFSGKTERSVEKLRAQARAISEAAQALGITHLHAHFGSDATTAALLAARKMGGTFSFTAHARDIWHTYVTPEADDAMRRAKLAAAAFTVTVSDYNARHLRSLCPAAASRILRLYNGIDLRSFAPVHPTTQRPGTLIAVGRLVEKKGFADLIEASALLRDRDPSFELDIIGDGPLQAELQQRIDMHKLNSQVRLCGPLRQEDLIERMSRAQAAVLPCVVTPSGDRDGLPTVLLEAMARGLPVITTDIAGGPEIVEDGVTGLLCPANAPDLLARALATVLSAPHRAMAMGAAGRRRAELLFDLTTNAGRLRAMLAHPHAAKSPEEVA
ncbi:glycosyltransferase family 4 protein [Palleronia caenipelagi]|nr:glycosyltransferase family 4 protein [Palleronia caenipelagi]